MPQSVLDKILHHFPTWKALLMASMSRLILIKSVLWYIMVYHSIAMELSKWFIKSL
jgi:hypothetical protein